MTPEISGYAVKGAGMNNKDAGSFCSGVILQEDSVHELGLATEIEVVCPRCNARGHDGLAQKAVGARTVEKASRFCRHFGPQNGLLLHVADQNSVR